MLKIKKNTFKFPTGFERQCVIVSAIVIDSKKLLQDDCIDRSLGYWELSANLRQEFFEWCQSWEGYRLLHHIIFIIGGEATILLHRAYNNGNTSIPSAEINSKWNMWVHNEQVSSKARHCQVVSVCFVRILWISVYQRCFFCFAWGFCFIFYCRLRVDLVFWIFFACGCLRIWRRRCFFP